MIRTYECRTDWPDIHAIDRACCEEPWEEETFRSRDRVILVSTQVSTKVCSFIAWHIHNDTLIIDKLCTLPRYRFLGHGSALLEHCMNRAKKHIGISIYVPLEVATWFQKAGFRADGTIERDQYGYDWVHLSTLW